MRAPSAERERRGHRDVGEEDATAHLPVQPDGVPAVDHTADPRAGRGTVRLVSRGRAGAGLHVHRIFPHVRRPAEGGVP